MVRKVAGTRNKKLQSKRPWAGKIAEFPSSGVGIGEHFQLKECCAGSQTPGIRIVNHAEIVACRSCRLYQSNHAAAWAFQRLTGETVTSNGHAWMIGHATPNAKLDFLAVDLPHIFFRVWHTESNGEVAISRAMHELERIMEGYQEIIVCIDCPPYKRSKIYPEYKSNRPSVAPELVKDYLDFQERIRARSVPVWGVAGFEADDLIATVAKKCGAAGRRLDIYSRDKDLLQLVTDTTNVISADGTRFDPQQVRATMGVAPRNVTDLLALMGDAIDNVPGCPNIGKKRALDLLNAFGSLKEVILQAKQRSTMPRSLPPAAVRSLYDNIHLVELSARLVELDDSAELGIGP